MLFDAVLQLLVLFFLLDQLLDQFFALVLLLPVLGLELRVLGS